MKVYKIKDIESGLYYNNKGWDRWRKTGSLYAKLSDIKQAFGDNGGMDRAIRHNHKGIIKENLRIETYELCPQGIITMEDLFEK